MCTLTVIRQGDEIIITSNRDEQLGRPAAIEPRQYDVNGKLVTFPKDPLGGGTWFAVDQSNNVIVLLNGAMKRHEFGGIYRKSRGLIVLDLISSSDILQAWHDIDLTSIEPFTLVILVGENLYETQWNGTEKLLSIITDSSKIWSSPTLYADDVMLERERFFAQQISIPTTTNRLIAFHSSADPKTPIVIDRGFLKTLSITQIQILADDSKISYTDLRNPVVTNL